jgi:hypothetical protein
MNEIRVFIELRASGSTTRPSIYLESTSPSTASTQCSRSPDTFINRTLPL